jgi:hypothetical protein
MTTEQKIIRAKVGLLELAKQLGNVSQACKMMGYSRDSFKYRLPVATSFGNSLRRVGWSLTVLWSLICGAAVRFLSIKYCKVAGRLTFP